MELIEFGGLLGVEFFLAAEQLVEEVGPLVQLLLERLEHFDLGRGRDSVATPALLASALLVAALLLLLAAGVLALVGLEAVDELLEPARGELLRPGQ